MATRVYHASDNSGGDTTTQSATVQTDHRTLTFTPDASSTYLILGYCETQVDNNAARDSQVRLYDDTAAAELELANVEMASAGGTEWYPVSFAYLATFGGSPSSQTYKIQHKLETTNSNTDSVCRNGTLVAIKLAAADASMSNDGTGTSTANPGAWTDYNAAAGDDALIFTPGTSGDYLILAFARLAYSATTNGAQLRLLCEDGSTAVATTRWVPTDSTTRHTWACAVKRTSLAASEHTFKIQHARVASGSGTSTLDFVRMVALRLDGFEANTATEDTGADTTTSASYVDLGDTRADTLEDGIDYLLLAAADVETNTIAVDTAVKLTDGTNTYAEAVIRAGVADRGLSFLVPRVVTGSGASVTHKFQGASNGTATLSLDEHRLFVLQVEAAAGGDATATPATVALTVAQPAAAARAGSTPAPSTAVLVLTQPAVSAAAHAAPAPATAALVIGQPAVEARAGSTASPDAASLTLAQPAVTATGGGSATSNPATTALTLAQPAVSVSAGSTPSPATAALVVAQPAASPQAGSTPSPAAAALTIAQPPAAASAGSTPTPAAVALTLAQPAVTATGGGSGTGTPATVALVLTQPLVAASAGAAVAPATTALTVAQPAVDAQAGSTASPATTTLVIAQPTVSPSAGSTVAPATTELTFAQPAVTATAGSVVTPATIVLVLTLPGVTATGGGAAPADPNPIDITVRERAYTATIIEDHHPTIRERAHVEIR